MSPRRLLQIALHLLLAVGLVAPGIAAQAQSVALAFATTSLGAATDRQDVGCGDMSPATMDVHPQKRPATPCDQHGCTMAACLGAGCLPTLPRVLAFVPIGESLITWEQPVRPSRVLDTPLRPPIA